MERRDIDPAFFIARIYRLVLTTTLLGVAALVQNKNAEIFPPDVGQPEALAVVKTNARNTGFCGVTSSLPRPRERTENSSKSNRILSAMIILILKQRLVR
jgi:hypothetical protein